MNFNVVSPDNRPSSQTDGRFEAIVSSKVNERITINGRRLDNSTGKFVDPSKWHPEMSKMRGNSEEAH